MPVLETARGLAIATSFAASGILLSVSYVILPNMSLLAEDEHTSTKTIAEHFRRLYDIGRSRVVPAELVAILIYGYLTYDARQTSVSTFTWKLYAGAAAAMIFVIPWTLVTMEEDCLKINALADVNHSDDQNPKLEHGDLAPPAVGGPVITPMEEFEPFEDSPFSAAEYEKLKVKKLLQSLATKNLVRVLAFVTAGSLALNAITTRVTLITLVQGQ